MTPVFFQCPDCRGIRDEHGYCTRCGSEKIPDRRQSQTLRNQSSGEAGVPVTSSPSMPAPSAR